MKVKYNMLVEGVDIEVAASHGNFRIELSRKDRLAQIADEVDKCDGISAQGVIWNNPMGLVIGKMSREGKLSDIMERFADEVAEIVRRVYGKRR